MVELYSVRHLDVFGASISGSYFNKLLDMSCVESATVLIMLAEVTGYISVLVAFCFFHSLFAMHDPKFSAVAQAPAFAISLAQPQRT